MNDDIVTAPIKEHLEQSPAPTGPDTASAAKADNQSKPSGNGAGKQISSPEMSQRLDIAKELLLAFKFERTVYLCAIAFTFILLVISGGIMVVKQQLDKSTMTLLFGSSGLTTFTGSRILRMWSDVLQLITGTTFGKD